MQHCYIGGGGGEGTDTALRKNVKNIFIIVIIPCELPTVQSTGIYIFKLKNKSHILQNKTHIYNLKFINSFTVHEISHDRQLGAKHISACDGKRSKIYFDQLSSRILS